MPLFGFGKVRAEGNDMSAPDKYHDNLTEIVTLFRRDLVMEVYFSLINVTVD